MKYIATLMLLVVLSLPRQASASTEYVVLVHAYLGTSASWNDYEVWLTQEGFTPVTLNLSSNSDNAANAAQIKALIDTLPAGSKVHIVAHSMGGISSRYYLKYLGGAARVSTYVALDTPQYGAWWTCVLMPYQLCPTSQFLRNLNSGDDTPGALTYVQFSANYPSFLDGGAYHADVTSGYEHPMLPHDHETFVRVLAVLRGDLSGVTHN